MKLPSAPALRRHFFDLLRYGAIGGAVYVLASQFVRHSSGPKLGTPAAAFDLPVAGQTTRVSLAEQKGKPVLMEVFGSWCSACKRSAPDLAEAYRAHGERGVTFLAVSVDEDPSAAARVKQEWQIPFDVLVDDGTVSRGYGVRMLPTFIFIDAQGTVRHATAGVPSRSDIDDWVAER